MEYLRLIGVLVVIVGFALRLRVTVVVLAAGLVTGLVAGMPVVGTAAAPGILDTLGGAFANQRVITLFVLALPAIGLSERYGLQEQARRLILRIRAATVGRLEMAYQLFRVVVVALGIRLGSGHVQFSRPLIVPMGLGVEDLDDERDRDLPEADQIKAASGASENYGNFFGQNLFFGAAGVALVISTFKDNGIAVDPRRVSLWSIPVAVAAVVVAAVQYWFLDRWLRRRRAARAEREEA
jgi:uncharacterized membrane protein